MPENSTVASSDTAPVIANIGAVNFGCFDARARCTKRSISAKSLFMIGSGSFGVARVIRCVLPPATTSRYVESAVKRIEPFCSGAASSVAPGPNTENVIPLTRVGVGVSAVRMMVACPLRVSSALTLARPRVTRSIESVSVPFVITYALCVATSGLVACAATSADTTPIIETASAVIVYNEHRACTTRVTNETPVMMTTPPRHRAHR